MPFGQLSSCKEMQYCQFFFLKLSFNEKYANGTSINVFLNPSKVETLKVLHGKYWEGLHCDCNGSPISEGDEGLGGNRGWRGSRVGGGATEEGDEGIGGSAPYFRPIGANGTISLPYPPTREGGSEAEQLARGLLEEDELMARLDFLCKESFQSYCTKCIWVYGATYRKGPQTCRLILDHKSHPSTRTA